MKSAQSAGFLRPVSERTAQLLEPCMMLRSGPAEKPVEKIAKNRTKKRYQEFIGSLSFIVSDFYCFYDLLRLAAGKATARPFFDRDSWYATSMGAATAMDEYVPIRIPTTSANEKPLNTWPPKI